MTHLGVVCVFLALSALSAVVWSEVGSFNNCPQFFYKGTPPQGMGNHPEICQRFGNVHRFASLYNQDWRTPIYSAYMLSTGGKRPKDVWMYEPQLANRGADSNMVPFPWDPVDQNVKESQAVLEDYDKTIYTKGHLSPSTHHGNELDKSATFTLTNIVPQRGESNNGPWGSLEESFAKHLSKYCNVPAYIVTGVLPYTSSSPGPKINNRVAVPEYLWSVYCCPSFNSNLPNYIKNTFPTQAAIGRNDPTSPEDIVPLDPSASDKNRPYTVIRMTLVELEKHLRDRLGAGISVFQNGCK